MSEVIRLKKGLDIKLEGLAQKVLIDSSIADSYAVIPSDFIGLTPKLLVKVDDEVKAGTPIFFDKYHAEVILSSPVSGKVKAINRGDKRKILEVVIEPSKQQEFQEYNVGSIDSLSRENVIEVMLSSGLWPMVIQRPYGIIADPTTSPKAIFVSSFDSSPLAPDMDFVLANQQDDLSAGVEVLKKLTTGKIHIGMSVSTKASAVTSLKGVEKTVFEGPHPAGNVGVQIHHVDPICKGETVWTIDIQNLAIVGRFFKSGKVDMTKIIAVAGSEIKEPRYQKIIAGASMNSIVKGNIKNSGSVRIISGNPLTGIKRTIDEHIGFYSNMVSVIPEGDYFEFLGWIAPRFNRFSVSRTYFSWLTPNKKYNLDTNLNGGERALVMSGQYEQVLPMDIYPVYLLKAALAGDIDKMENLGIYEVVEEDLALCEFVCTSKTEVQKIIREGINLLIKELN